MNPYVLDLITASPEVLVLAMGCLILIFDLFVKDPTHTATFVLSLLTLVGAAVLTLFTSTGEVVYAFNGLYVDDLMGDLLKLVLYLTVIVTLFYARPYVLQRPDLRRGEFYVLVLFATLGMMVMISANDLMSLYLGLELLSLPLYVLASFDRDNPRSAEAGLKYFVLGALASGLLSGRYDATTTFPADDHRTYNRHGEAFDVGETFSGVPYDVGLAAVAELRGIVPEGVATAAFALQPGQVSPAPVRTQFGWHIAKVNDRRTRDATVEARRGRVRQSISVRKEAEEYETWVRRLREDAYVEYRMNGSETATEAAPKPAG